MQEEREILISLTTSLYQPTVISSVIWSVESKPKTLCFTYYLLFFVLYDTNTANDYLQFLMEGGGDRFNPFWIWINT